MLRAVLSLSIGTSLLLSSFTGYHVKETCDEVILSMLLSLRVRQHIHIQDNIHAVFSPTSPSLDICAKFSVWVFRALNFWRYFRGFYSYLGYRPFMDEIKLIFCCTRAYQRKNVLFVVYRANCSKCEQY